jgi:hypothetical protein
MVNFAFCLFHFRLDISLITNRRVFSSLNTTVLPKRSLPPSCNLLFNHNFFTDLSIIYHSTNLIFTHRSPQFPFFRVKGLQRYLQCLALVGHGWGAVAYFRCSSVSHVIVRCDIRWYRCFLWVKKNNIKITYKNNSIITMYKTPLKFKNPDLKKYESKTLKKGKSLCLASLAWKDLDIQASGWGLSCKFEFISSPFLLPWVVIVSWPAGRHCPRSWTWSHVHVIVSERGLRIHLQDTNAGDHVHLHHMNVWDHVHERVQWRRAVAANVHYLK